MERIFLSPPFMGRNEQKYIQEAFDQNWIAPLGENVDLFEQEQCRQIGCKYGVALNAGTAAIDLALRWYGVGQGDYVFCSDLTFIGTCGGIYHRGAIPVFIDSDYETWNMSPAVLNEAFLWAKKEGKLPKVVIVVDLYGQSADYDSILELCNHYGVPVLEDAAEAVGAKYHGNSCGSFGDSAVISYNGNKIVTTSGGGMLVSDNKDMIDKARFWATQARDKASYYQHTEVGYNYRLSNICAGIGRGQLEILDLKLQKRKQNFLWYQKEMRNLPIRMMPIFEEPNFWLSVMTIELGCKTTPDMIIQALEENNIEARRVWKPMHLQPVFETSPFFANEEYVGKDLFERGICLPSGDALDFEQKERILDIIKGNF